MPFRGQFHPALERPDVLSPVEKPRPLLGHGPTDDPFQLVVSDVVHRFALHDELADAPFPPGHDAPLMGDPCDVVVP